MFRSEKNVGEPLLMKIAEFESHIAQLNGAIRTNPQKPIALARNLHCNEWHCFPPKVSANFPAAFSDSFSV